MVHTISEKAMEIIRRGGRCTPQEMEYLYANTPCDEYPYANGYYIQYFLLIYLPEIKGYCSIYWPMTPYPCYPLEWIYDENISPPTHNHIDKEVMQARINEWHGKEPYQMRFHDLAYIREFDSYDELEKYCRTTKQNKYFVDPRNDPEFNTVYNQGIFLNEDECFTLLRYRNYCVFSKETSKIYAVIVLGECEKLYVEVGFWRDINSPFKPDYIVPPASQGDFYIERDGKIFLPYYEDSKEKIIL